MDNDFLLRKKMPYICIPLTGASQSIIDDELQTTLSYQPDVIEWRVDFFDRIEDVHEVQKVIKQIKLSTPIPLLFTIRAEHEGGECIPLNKEEKIDLLLNICQDSAIDIVDFEMSNGIHAVERVRQSAQSNNKKLILSYHNFTHTPSNDDIIQLAIKAEAAGADVAKIAVMPKIKNDVLRLLQVTKKIDEMLSIPVVTMSMGEIGGLSRVIGWAYGSAMTFGVGVTSSAPGQLPAHQLRAAIEKTQQLVKGWP